MSGKLAPSKSTVYVSNLPFSLTNSDLHKIFEKYGKVVKVTVMKDKVSRQSKGVAFVLFLDKDGAIAAVRALNNTKMFERTITCTIAKDNGRAAEFIRRKEYLDKSRCYECGEEGHMSYKCPNNLLGEREPPPKKKRKKKGDDDDEDEDGLNSRSGSDEEGQSNAASEMEDSLAAAIRFQQAMMAKQMGDGDTYSLEPSSSKRKRYKKDAYFSDEEELDD